MHPPKPIRGMFNWYYARIYIKVRPERVFVWPEGDLAGAADRPRRAPGGGALRSRRGAARRTTARRPAGSPAWDERMDVLAEHDTGVLSWMGPDGFPIAVRVPFSADASRREIAIEGEPAGLPLLEGRACLTVHRHAPDFTWQRNMQVRGDLVALARGLAAGAPQDRRRLRAPRGAPHPLPGLHPEGPRLLPDLPPPPARALSCSAQEPIFGGNGSRPAFQGPGL